MRRQIAAAESSCAKLAAAAARLEESERELERLLLAAQQGQAELARQAAEDGAVNTQLTVRLEAMDSQWAAQHAALEAAQTMVAERDRQQLELQTQIAAAQRLLAQKQEDLAKAERVSAAEALLKRQQADRLAVQNGQLQQLQAIVDTERKARLAAQADDDKRVRQVAQRDLQIVELQARVADQAAQVGHARERLALLRLQAEQAADRHDADMRQLRAAAAQHHQQTEASAQQRESQLRAHLLVKEAAMAAQHQGAFDALHARLADLQAALDDQEQRRAAERRSATEMVTTFATWHHAALTAREAAHELQMRMRLLDHDRVQTGIMAALQQRYDEETALTRALRDEVAGLRRTWPPSPAPELTSVQRSQTPGEAAAVVELANAKLAAQRAAALQAELGALRQALDVEQVRSASLAREVEHLARAERPESQHSGFDALPLASTAVPAQTTIPIRDALASEPVETLPMSENLTLDQLLALHDEAFVQAAYLKVLLRRPEPEGLCNHLELLHSGTSKESILLALLQSDEGRSVDGGEQLAEVLQRRAKLQNTGLLARVRRRLLGLDPEGITQRINAAENRLGSQVEGLARAQQRSEDGTATLSKLMLAVEGKFTKAHQQEELRHQVLQRLSDQFDQCNQRVAGLGDRMAQIDHRFATLESTLARVEQISDASLGHLRQAAEANLGSAMQILALTREEGRLTRSVVGIPWPQTPVESGPGGMGKAVQSPPLDHAGFARVRELLLPKGTSA